MAGFKIQCTTSAPAEDVTLPTVSGQVYNATVYWGDTSQSTITAYDDPDITHNYASAGDYTIEIQGQFDGWSVNNTHASKLQWTDIIDWGDAVDFDGFAYLSGGWYGCSNLVSLGVGKILAKAGLTTLYLCFRNCSGLVGSIPDGFLDNCTQLTTIHSCWRGCTGLAGSIPDGLLDNCTLIITMSFCWGDCSSLTGQIPEGFLANCPLVASVYYCWSDCDGLTASPWMFYADGEQATEFLNRTVNFTNCFSRSAFTGSIGQVPDLWNCDFGTETPTKADCFAGAGNSLTSAINYNNIPAAWGGSGYVDTPPEMTSIDASGAGIVITGTDFEAAGGALYICDENNLATATKTAQSISHDDVSITVAALDFSGLDADRYYLYFVDSDDQINDSGWPVTRAYAFVEKSTGAKNLTGHTVYLL